VPTLFERSLTAEQKGSVVNRRWSKLLRLIGIFLLWWLLTAIVYRETTSNFFRAESGWFLFLSRSGPAVEHDLVKAAFTKNYHGHYAPFAFLAEFEITKLAGTSGAFWKWRQITVLAVLATALFQFGRASGTALGLTRVQAPFSAAALIALLVFQVQMREFIAWPFMVIQLLWLLFSVLALLSLVRMTQYPAETKWPWLAAAAAYLSVHSLGLGIATVAATAVAMTGVWLARRRASAVPNIKIAKPLLSLLGITALHGVAMQNFMRGAPIVPSPGWKPAAFITELLGYIPNLLFTASRSLISTTHSGLGPGQVGHDWPYGIAVLLAIALLVSAAFFRLVKEPGVRNETRLLLHSFASMLFLTLIALVSIRQWSEPTPNGFAEYLNGPRYLIPVTFALIGIVTELFLLVAWLPAWAGVIFNVSVVICAAIAHLYFAANVYPKAAPHATISHDRAWRSIVAMARECQSAGLAIPNVPLGALTHEFGDWDLKVFVPLLRADLKLPPETKLEFLPWTDVANAPADNYTRQVPSLAKVRKRLNLNEKTP
jgi:hypothetical protein